MMDNFDGERSGAVLDERFELLSAYLDGEATVSERQQVEAWLANDTTFQQQYRQMQQLHHALPQISVPSSQSVATLSTEVFAKIDRQRNRKLAWFGGGAIAATVAATIAGLGGLFGDGNLELQFVINPKSETPAAIEVALNDPILAIPTKSERTIEVPMYSPEVNVD
jgi:anti-sigma factor RsiW